MLKKKGEKRTTRDNIKLAGILSCIAGYTNALAFLTLLMLNYSNSVPIIIEGCVLIAVSLIPYKSLNFIMFISLNFMPLFLSFAMGMQSASTTYLSSAIVRTTHLTGAATDIGMAIVRRDLKAFVILFTILSGFILGAFLGSFANAHLGISGFLFPGVITLSIGIAYL
ncbi:DUF1275 domain-containing protein [Candidatus Desantisbacteria bacterium]|nr:DUF1275 domain-containing protein [Candidatus Desantisbacteria bacterium]